MKISVPATRILTFDIENRPLSYWFDGQTTAEITCIAWSWGKQVTAMALGDHSLDTILVAFREAYDQADIVTGHYIRKHDLPILNSHMLEAGMSPLSGKLTHDTRLDFRKGKDLSLSQESLAAMLGCKAPKVKMDQTKWRAANRLSGDGIALTVERCVGDVKQHMEMRGKLLELGWLRPPRMWRP